MITVAITSVATISMFPYLVLDDKDDED